MTMKKKKKGYGLEIKTFRGRDGASYRYSGLERVHSMCS